MGTSNSHKAMTSKVSMTSSASSSGSISLEVVHQEQAVGQEESGQARTEPTRRRSAPRMLPQPVKDTTCTIQASLMLASIKISIMPMVLLHICKTRLPASTTKMHQAIMVHTDQDRFHNSRSTNRPWRPGVRNRRSTSRLSTCQSTTMSKT